MATTKEPPHTTSIPHSIQYCRLKDDSFANILFTMHTHPSASLLATGDISGNINLYSYHPGQDSEIVRSFNHHKGSSCRVLKFSKSGNRVFSGSNKHGDLYATDVETGKLLQCIKKAHSAPLYSMHTVSENVLASGDEKGEMKMVTENQSNLFATSGAVQLHFLRSMHTSQQCNQEFHEIVTVTKPLQPLQFYTTDERHKELAMFEQKLMLWDTRSWRNTMTLRENKDFISNMVTDDERRTLLATSGDGSLTAVDLRQRRLEQQSDHTESELLSLALVKGGRKVVCGDGEGSLMIYHWGLWGDITDRYPGHPQAIDCLVKISDSVICTGCMDGVLRSVHVLPNQILSNVGHHSESLPIDSMCLTHDKIFLVTCSQDSCKFWAVEDIPKLSAVDTKTGEGEDGWSQRKRRKRKQRQRDADEKGNSATMKDDFFADLCN